MTLVCAHGGARVAALENSHAALQAALASGCEVIETDVRADTDGRLVLAHDPVLGGGDGLQSVDALLALARGRVALDLDIKEPATIPAVAAAIANFPDCLMISSDFSEALTAISRIDPRIRTGLVVEPPYAGDPIAAARRCGADALLVEEPLLDDALLAAAELEVWVWTINERSALRRWLTEPRVACVITDDPALAMSLRPSSGDESAA